MGTFQDIPCGVKNCHIIFMEVKNIPCGVKNYHIIFMELISNYWYSNSKCPRQQRLVRLGDKYHRS